ncbi:MAG: hypothetical protein U0136_10990 [Bdellovibrionota bacterium]
MDYRNFASVVALLSSLALCSCAGDPNRSITDESLDSGDTTPTQSTKIIGPEGGTIFSNDGNFRIDFPSGALSESKSITITKRPVSDLPAAVRDSASVTTLYMLEPEGVTFQVPATATMTISSPGSVSGDTIEIPQRILAQESQNALSVPSDQHATLDANVQVLTLSGQLSHFSRIWDNLPKSGALAVTVSGVPATPDGGNPFNAEVSVAHSSGSAVTTSGASVSDASVSPISSAAPLNQSLGGFSDTSQRTLSASASYACSAAGNGNFASTVSFNDFDATALVVPFGFERRAGESYVIRYSTGVVRKLLCTSGADANNGDQSVAPGTGVDLDKDSLEFAHNTGSTACPQDIGTVKVTNDSDLSESYEVSVDSSAVTVDPESFSLQPGASKEISFSFVCNRTSSFDAVATVTGTSSSQSVSKDISINGTVQ